MGQSENQGYIGFALRTERKEFMRIEKRIIYGKEYKFICPDKVEYIKHIDFSYGQGDADSFEIGIDGDVYICRQRLSVAPRDGYCHLRKKAKDRNDKTRHDDRYYCDDPVLIAALARYFNTYNWGGKKSPEIGFLLPLLSREESQQYINWHLIPQPPSL